MSASPIQIGASHLRWSGKEIQGEFVSRGSERFYRIANYDRMSPFFMSIVSASNHWLFLSSNGGLTAGRRDANNALFPYTTEDKIHDGSNHTGSRSVLRVSRAGRRFLWEPFSRHCGALYDISRNLYKNVYGNKVLFEEVNRDLELVFRYTWTTSDAFGFIKHSELVSSAGEPVSVEVLDGIENLLPWGMDEFFQSKFSCLGDAYKDNVLEAETGLATYAFSSVPGDSPEPTEALRATVCWSTCRPEAPRLLSSQQLDAFRRGAEVGAEPRVRGRRGAYFVVEMRELDPGERQDWLLVADLEYGLGEVAALRRRLSGSPAAKVLVQEDVEVGTRRLKAIVARADGLQKTGDGLGSDHHFANVLFNVMRGGVFESAYTIDPEDLQEFVRAFNRESWQRHRAFFDSLGREPALGALLSGARSVGDPHLLRLVLEYLPISFSRRHGDPSRPWNQFSINLKRRDGSRILDYQGNWRDIFQNWEALCWSFPQYLEGVIGKFVNTTTADGYNPYRVTRDGYDWEVPSPDEPWAHFGYWGDHQLIYLLKLLELARAHYPGALEQMLTERRFVYAEVPYDLKPYDELLADPRDSLVYSTERAAKIGERVAAIGFDGRYLTDPSAAIHRVNLAEKLLVPLLAKIGGFVPGGGFWMNTQRPEWNDANNALAGYGVSMVTLYYARRYVRFCLGLLPEGAREVRLSREVATWLAGTFRVLDERREMLERSEIGDRERKSFLDGLGRVAEQYRRDLYANGLSGRGETVAVGELRDFLQLTLEYFDQTIALNRRDDGLYHAYNVLGIEPQSLAVEHLGPMLEGQVAVLSSGALGSREALSVLRALRRSEMYRADQQSYLLYPDRQLPSFLDKNRIPAELVGRSELLRRLAATGNTELVEEDVDGGFHFNGLFRNARDLHAALDRLRDGEHADLVEEEAELIGEIFEAVFEHRRFTGRSGTFYGYEGLGCIYWHQVSKLLLAVQECCGTAAARADDGQAELAEAYYEVRSGLGFNKTPEVYGAFPTDPYSHTPGDGGARQPGMTGQVKEEILTRFGELGLSVREGQVRFDPALLRRSEFLEEAGSFDYYDAAGEPRRLELDQGTLAYTYCQVPVVYRMSQTEELTLHLDDGETRVLDGLVLDRQWSTEIFRRTGRVARVEVSLMPGLGL